MVLLYWWGSDPCTLVDEHLRDPWFCSTGGVQIPAYWGMVNGYVPLTMGSVAIAMGDRVTPS